MHDFLPISHVQYVKQSIGNVKSIVLDIYCYSRDFRETILDLGGGGSDPVISTDADGELPGVAGVGGCVGGTSATGHADSPTTGDVLLP